MEEKQMRPTNHDRTFVRTFFTSPTAVDAEDSAEMLRKAAQLRGLQAPDVWVPDNEDATAPSMRDEGVDNVLSVVAEHGANFPGQIHPRVVWHRNDPATRRTSLEHMRRLADPAAGAIEHIDGFVIPEVGAIDDWKKADEFITIVEDEHGLEEGRLAMSVIVESAAAELALEDVRAAVGNPSNNLERLFLLVDGEVDYTKDMRGMTPTGELPAWPELRHNTSRAASANGLIAIDGPYDDIRDVAGYRERMTANQAKGMLGIWSLTPGQVVEANTAPLPPADGSYRLEVDDRVVELHTTDGVQVYEGDHLTVASIGDDQYRLREGGVDRELDGDALHDELRDRTTYIPSLVDIVESMAEFEAAKAAGKGAISMERTTTIRIGDVSMEVHRDRMWDEATYQAAKTPISLFQEVYESRPDQREELAEIYGEDVVDHALEVG